MGQPSLIFLAQDPCQLYNEINIGILLLTFFGCLFPDQFSQKTFFKAEGITRARANTNASPNIVASGERIALANQALAD